MSEGLESLYEYRVEQARTRGFIPREDATEIQIARGLEDMHEAPLEKIGQFLLTETIDVSAQAS